MCGIKGQLKPGIKSGHRVFHGERQAGNLANKAKQGWDGQTDGEMKRAQQMDPFQTEEKTHSMNDFPRQSI